MNSHVAHLLDTTRTLRRYERALTAASGEAFNLFEILNIGSLEVGTHSPVIAELLSPKGRHGLGDRFLRLFVFRFKLSLDCANTHVRQEHYLGPVTETSGGRIDIFLRDIREQIVVIENKIYAADQPNQISRYRNDLPSAQIVYLTLDGHAPAGSGDVTTRTVHCLSYATDIIPWLEDCRQQAVGAPLVRETITQYINLIKRLTGQSANSRMNKEITEIVTRDEESIAAYFELVQSKTAVIRKVMDRLRSDAEQIAADLQLKLGFSSDELLVKESTFWFWDERMKASNITISFQFQVPDHRQLNFGVSYCDPDHPELAPPGIFERFCAEFGPASKVRWWPAVTDWPERRSWDSDTYAAICFGQFKQELREKVEKVARIVRGALDVVPRVS